MEKKYTDILHITDVKSLAPRVVGPWRRKLVNYARSLKGSTLNNPIVHKLWRVGEYDLGFLKPGKETAPDAKTNHKDGTVGPNPDDMTPTIWRNGSIIKAPASFEEIFHVFEKLLKEDEEDAMEILAGLFYRSAYLYDYTFGETETMPSYDIDPRILKRLEDCIPKVTGGIPAEVYLKYLQLIALNEEVKYNALGYDIEKVSTGRQGNLRTYTYLIAVLLGRMPLAVFCYAFARTGGVAPIGGKSAAQAFPWLRAEKAEKTLKQVKKKR